MEPAGWFADVEAIARFFGNLHGEFGRDFVVGISDAQTGIAEDLYCIGREAAPRTVRKDGAGDATYRPCADSARRAQERSRRSERD
jgi:hypothetical protein